MESFLLSPQRSRACRWRKTVESNHTPVTGPPEFQSGVAPQRRHLPG